MRWFDSEAAVPAAPAPSSDRPPEVLGADIDDEVTGVRPIDRATAPTPVQLPDTTVALLGPLAAYATSGVTDLLLGPAGRLWVDQGSGAVPAPGWEPLDEAEVSELALSLIEAGGRHLDNASPCVDVALGRGVRVHAALPPVSVGGTVVSIRLPVTRGWTLDDLVAADMLQASQAVALRRRVAERANILITGAAGSGKTTLLSALMHEVPARERILTIEDVAELQIHHPHVVALETRQANSEGAGAVDLPRLVREALRMRPDRLVLGECRGEEVRELLMALGTGHDGGAGTLHARSLAEVPTRLEALGALAGLSAEALARLAASALDLVVHIERVDGRRRVAGFGRLIESDGRLMVLSEDGPRMPQDG